MLFRSVRLTVLDHGQPGTLGNQTEAPAPPTVAAAAASPGTPPSQQVVPPQNSEQQKALGDRLDAEIRNLLRFYRIDDGDFVEVDDGSLKRLLLVHPERPLPTYIQQDKALFRQLQGER